MFWKDLSISPGGGLPCIVMRGRASFLRNKMRGGIGGSYSIEIQKGELNKSFTIVLVRFDHFDRHPSHTTKIHLTAVW